MILKWRSAKNLHLFGLRGGAFGISFDVPKLEGSKLTMVAKLYSDPKMEVGTKHLSVWPQIPLAWHLESIWN